MRVSALVALLIVVCATAVAAQQYSYDPDFAKYAAYLSAVTTCSKDVIESWSGLACTKVPGVTEAAVFQKKTWLYSSYGYVAFDGHANRLIVAFKGTDDLADTLADLDMFHTKLWDTGVNVHTGFLRSYEACKEQWYADFDRHNQNHPDAEIVVLGHSLGGAQATLAALDLTYRHRIDPNRMMVFTFGSPRVGADNSFYPFFVSEIPLGRSWRIVHNHDIVPDLPPSYFSYEHVPIEVWYNKDNTEFKVCEPTKDCGPQLNLSSKDHHFYVGVPIDCGLERVEIDDGAYVRALARNKWRYNLAPNADPTNDLEQ